MLHFQNALMQLLCSYVCTHITLKSTVLVKESPKPHCVLLKFMAHDITVADCIMHCVNSSLTL